MSFGKAVKIFFTIIWLAIFVPAAFVVNYTVPKIDNLLKWARQPGTNFLQKLLRFVVVAPIMAIFIPLVFIVKAGSAAIETNFTKHI